MNTELDKIKSTITISLGTKNRLRKLKGNQSYEELINYLIRIRNNQAHMPNFIEIQKFKRKKGLYAHNKFKILFSYNKYTPSNNFIFDIAIDIIREDGKIIPFKSYLEKVSKEKNKFECRLYFELLETAIRNEIESLFKHKGRVEDYYLWDEEFKMLNLSKSSLENDVMDKLNSYGIGEGVLE